jgi:N-acetylmuramic acid 6-phosphate etherase
VKVLDNNYLLETEKINPNTVNIDQLDPLEILKIMNKEDEKVIYAIRSVLKDISAVVEIVVDSIKNGGHIFFVGAGTSGRLGVLEAVECPPTFSVDDDLFQAVMAGGYKAVYSAVESAEDNFEDGKEDIKSRGVTNKDIVVGIAASGKTPYVIGALEWAKKIGAKTVALTCNPNSVIGKIADYKIEAVPGPEVISGSTRMKAGTTQKMILNMITTTAMIKLGKVYQNLMVDLHISNQKLKERAINIIRRVTNAEPSLIEKTLELSRNNVKAAIVMIKNNVSYEEAVEQLNKNNGFIQKTIK